MKSSAALFQKVAVKTPSRSVFDLSHDHKTTMNWGVLAPIMCLEALPGDSFNIKHQALIRLAPQLAPLMHRVDVKINTFFVPNRLIWKNWEAFITSTKLTDTGELPVHPYMIFSNQFINSDTDSLMSVADYLGARVPYPQKYGAENRFISYSALPFAAYHRIWFDWFRDQNLSGVANDEWESLYGLPDGNIAFGSPLYNRLQNIQSRSFEHDYFTAALPWSQKGDQVEIPLGSVELRPDWTNSNNTIPRWVTHTVTGDTEQGFQTPSINADGVSVPITNPVGDGNIKGAQYMQVENTPDDPYRLQAYDPHGSLTVQPITINELRRAESLQTYLELLARGGSRYVEYIKNFFDTDPQDYRLDRAEYICGSVTPVTMSEVLNTTGYDGQLPQGNMSGHAAAVINTDGEWYHCKEHGFIMSIASVVPRTSYCNGVHRMFFRFDPLDYFVNQFEGLGEQEVYNDEVFAAGTTSATGFSGQGKEPFGYMPRHIDYKFIPSRCSGYMRPSWIDTGGGQVQQNLSFWNLSRYFDDLPALNNDFINARNTRDDVFIVQDGSPFFYCHFGNLVTASRRMKKFNIPTL